MKLHFKDLCRLRSLKIFVRYLKRRLSTETTTHHVWRNLLLDVYPCVLVFFKNPQQKPRALRTSMYVSCCADSYIFWPKMPLYQKGPEWHCELISDGGATQPRVLGFQLWAWGDSNTFSRSKFCIYLLAMPTFCLSVKKKNLLICICCEFVFMHVFCFQTGACSYSDFVLRDLLVGCP